MPPSSRVPDPAELADDLAEIKAAVDRGFSENRKAIDALSARIESTYVRKDVYDLGHKQLALRVSNVEDRHTWVARTAMTALMLPILVGIVVAIILTSTGGS